MNTNRNAPVPLSRRRFLKVGLGSAAALSLGALAGCDEEPEVTPTKGLKVWIAQSASGLCLGALSASGISGVTVVFRAGLTPQYKLEVGRDVTDGDGKFEMTAAGSPRGDAGYWRFIIEDDHPRDVNGDVTVYCEFLAIQGEWTEEYSFELIRRPRTTLPFPNPSFFLQRNLYIPWS
jgi:hypothetical protein